MDKLKRIGILPWIALFLLVNVFFHQSAGTNADSRYALLCALAEEGGPRIDRYHQWTADWARTPDGHYYSNKAPGPVLMAYPLFRAIDRFVTAKAPDREARDALRLRYKGRILKALSWVVQMLPFAALVGAVAASLAAAGVSSVGIHVAIVAMLFGNTAAFFHNTFYGHGFTAVWALGAALALVRRRAGWLGFCLGWAVLSDYGSLCLLPAAALAWGRRSWGRVALGALIPAALWVAYHQIAFGSPFTLANRYQNPLFVDLATEPVHLWGILTLPRLEILAELLWGAERGLLLTQPWLLPLLLLVPLFGRPEDRPLAYFAFAGLALLLVMNASFGGWHGGLTPGARYLSAVLPLFGWLLGRIWDRLPPFLQWAEGTALAVAVAFFILVFANHITPPNVALWPAYARNTFVAPTPTTLLRMACLVPLFVGTLIWIRRRSRLRYSPWR